MKPVDWTDISGARCGVASAGLYGARNDVLVLVAPGTVAAVVTQSTAAASSCLWTRQRAPGRAHAVVINAGNANAATGPEGAEHTRMMAEVTAARLGCPVDDVLVCSTGVIGVPLPIQRVTEAIGRATRCLDATSDEAARAIMTTDLAPKTAGLRIGDYGVAGFAKGSGMIHPNMATMLAFVVTDATIAAPDLQAVLRDVADRTFNMVTVDGDTSTNDTLILQATGEGDPLAGASLRQFEAALESVCRDLAKAIARDGEGATRLIEVTLQGCPTDRAARQAARAIVRSPLVKTAITGCDPNWGRIISALGAEGVAGLDRASVRVAGVDLLEDGRPLRVDETEASRAMDQDEVAIHVQLPGDGYAVAWGCDLTGDYVRINADYRS